MKTTIIFFAAIQSLLAFSTTEFPSDQIKCRIDSDCVVLPAEPCHCQLAVNQQTWFSLKRKALQNQKEESNGGCGAMGICPNVTGAVCAEGICEVTWPGKKRTLKKEETNARLEAFNHCEQISDCFDTKMRDLKTKKGCFGCGILIHKDEKEKFNELADPHPKPVFCDYSETCAIKCIQGKCESKELMPD